MMVLILKVVEIYDNQMSVGKPFFKCSIVSRGTEYEHRTGMYISEKGIVTVYDEPKTTVFQFVHKGQIHSKTITRKQKPFTEKGLAIRAGKFLKQVLISVP